VGATSGPHGVTMLDHEYAPTPQIHHGESKFHVECHGILNQTKTGPDI
jgi:hypothetical protein